MSWESFINNSIYFNYISAVYTDSVCELCKIHKFQNLNICQVISILKSDILLEQHDNDENIKVRNVVQNKSDSSL